jgi:hypothetical protein
MELQQQQCELHPERGAVARCPDCGRFYCHECITEHLGVVLCKRCLNKKMQQEQDASGLIQRHGILIKACAVPFAIAAGYILLFFVFASLGLMLIRFPDDFYQDVSKAFTEEVGVDK